MKRDKRVKPLSDKSVMIRVTIPYTLYNLLVEDQVSLIELLELGHQSLGNPPEKLLRAIERLQNIILEQNTTIEGLQLKIRALERDTNDK